ncbi:MAG: hypothetical protein QM747_11640 [Nocardioides sp.]
MTTDTRTHARSGAVLADEPATESRRWAWWGVAAGVLGVIGTIVTLDNASGDYPTADRVADLHSGTSHIGGAAGYLAVVALLVTAGAWRARVVRRMPRSIAARVVADGLTASAGALALGYGWKLALGDYLQGGTDHGMFDKSGLFVYYVLNDFGPFIGWLGVTVAAGAMVVLALRERVVPRWIGFVSIVPILAVTVYSLVLGVPGFPGVVGPLWMIVTFGALALRRSGERA